MFLQFGLWLPLTINLRGSWDGYFRLGKNGLIRSWVKTLTRHSCIAMALNGPGPRGLLERSWGAFWVCTLCTSSGKHWDAKHRDLPGGHITGARATDPFLDPIPRRGFTKDSFATRCSCGICKPPKTFFPVECACTVYT